MRFLELEKNLGALKSVYVITGEDRFLCFEALKLIKARAVPNFSELNYVTLEPTITLPELKENLAAYPFSDEKRVAVILDFKPKKGKDELTNFILDYSKSTDFSTVLVVVGQDLSFKEISQENVIDCNKLSEPELLNFIEKRAKEIDAKIKPSAAKKLIDFTLGDLTRIITELDKLNDYKAGLEIDDVDVTHMVSKDKEYQVFEIQEKIAKNDREAAIDIVSTILEKEKNAYSIITPLYNNYKRALFVAINKDLTEDELARYLQVKPYAIKMLKNQTSAFSAKKLKTIVDQIYELDNAIKQGKIKDDVGLIKLITNILMIRNK